MGSVRAFVRWVVVLCVVADAAALAAQDAKPELPEIVVTATRTHTRLEDIPASVTVIDGTDIEQRGQHTAAEALRGAPGVDVVEFGSPGQSAVAAIRGAAPDQVLVQVDGVEVNTPTVGQFDFADLTSDNLDRIEVLRGGGGSLYGSEAIGGVINVITRRGDGPFRLSLSGEGGSASTHREAVGLRGARGPLAVAGTASFFASDGFRSVNDDYRNFSTVWRADADLLPGGTVRGFLRYSNARAGLVNFNVADQGRLDVDARSRTDFFLAKSEWEHAVTESLSYRTSASIVRNNRRFRDDDTEGGEATEPIVIAHSPNEILTAETQCDYLWQQYSLRSE